MAGTGGLSPALRDLAASVADRLPDTPIVVALSGGADSAILAWAAQAAGRSVRVVSVDHGLPGSASLMDAAREIARKLGIPHEVVAVSQRSASETDLRESRLAALEAAAGQGEVIATGHTRDDLAETVLGNVLRGTGTSGLAGIPATRGRWVRPMLDVTRAAARAGASELGLPFVDDPQNEDLTIRRNRLRSDAIPRLAVDFNPALVDALARLGAAAGEDDRLLELRAARVPVADRDGDVVIPAASLQTLPASIAARVVRRGLRRLGDAHAGEAADVAAVLRVARGGRVTIGGGIDAVREGPWVVLVGPDRPVPEPVILEPGSEGVWGEWFFRSRHGVEPVVGAHTVVVPAGPVVVRSAGVGDRIGIGAGSKAVRDALAEAGVPPRLRSRWPVVESDGTIVWIAGVRAAPGAGDGGRVTVRAARRQT